MLTYDDKLHKYFYDNRELPSVTTILKSEGLIDYGNIPHAVLEKAKARGKYVHKAVEFINENDLDFNTLSKEYKPFVEAYQEFVNVTRFTPISIEQKVVNIKTKGLEYAGTLDATGILYDKKIIIDYKTGLTMPAQAGIQLAAYELCLPERHKRYGLLLRKNGTYKLVAFTDHSDYDRWLEILASFFKREKENQEHVINQGRVHGKNVSYKAIL
mgnify:CR=1 FL=1